MKKFLSITLAIVMLFSLSSVAFAEDEEDMDMGEYPEPIIGCIVGTITETTPESITIVNNDVAYMFTITGGTYLFDASYKLPLLATNIGKDKIASVYFDLDYDDGVDALCVITNFANDNVNCFYMQVEEITAESSDSVSFINTNYDTVVTVTADSEIKPYKTKNIVTIADIDLGAELIVQYDIATMSLPAQATSTYTCILSSYDGALADAAGQMLKVSKNEGAVIVEGVGQIPLAEGDEVYSQGGAVMVPLRTIVEYMGGEVEWDNIEKAVEVMFGDISALVRINDEVYECDGEEYTTTAPVMKNGKTHVPVTFFTNILGIQVDNI